MTQCIVRDKETASWEAGDDLLIALHVVNLVAIEEAKGKVAAI
jgi:hypothetical protein